MQESEKKHTANLRNKAVKAEALTKPSIPIQWNHTRVIAQVVSTGTEEASKNARQISDAMIKVKNGVLVEEKKNGEIRTIKEINPIPVNKQTITLHFKKKS